MSNIYYSRLEALQKILATQLPKFNIKFKNESILMKFIGILTFFNPRFMTDFTTTLGYTIYFPSRDKLENTDNDNYLTTIAHEFRHMVDMERMGRLKFSLSYVFPQILAPLMLLFAFLSWPLAIVLFIICLLPWPAYWRTKIELNGYIMSLFVINELLKEYNVSEITRQKQLMLYLDVKNSHFTSFEYYLMWPFGVEEKLKEAIDLIVSEEIKNQDVIYRDISQALEISK